MTDKLVDESTKDLAILKKLHALVHKAYTEGAIDLATNDELMRYLGQRAVHIKNQRRRR